MSSFLYFTNLWHQMPNINCIFSLLDYICATITYQCFMNSVIFLFGSGLTWSLFMIIYFRHLLKLFVQVALHISLFAMPKIAFAKNSNRRIFFLLDLVPRRHLYICWLLLVRDKARSLLSFIGFFNGIPIQIYLLYRIMFHPFPGLIILTISLMVILSITLYLIVFFMCIANYTVLVHRPKKYLNHIQLSLKRSAMIRQKLQYFFMYERVMLGTYSLNFGSQSAITYGFLFKVFLKLLLVYLTD